MVLLQRTVKNTSTQRTSLAPKRVKSMLRESPYFNQKKKIKKMKISNPTFNLYTFATAR